MGNAEKTQEILYLTEINSAFEHHELDPSSHADGVPVISLQMCEPRKQI